MNVVSVWPKTFAKLKLKSLLPIIEFSQNVKSFDFGYELKHSNTL